MIIAKVSFLFFSFLIKICQIQMVELETELKLISRIEN